MNITKKIPLDAWLYKRLLHQEHKFPICVIRTRYPDKKVVQTIVFPIVFATGI